MLDAVLTVEVLKYTSVFFIGMFLHFLMLSPKIKQLTNTIDALVNAIRRLENKAENVDKLRSDLFELEKRVSSNEAHIETLKSQSKFLIY